MPCTDGGVPYPDTPNEATGKKLHAVVCAMMRIRPDVVKAVLDMPDCGAGVTYAEVNRWFVEHAKRDTERRYRNFLSSIKPGQRVKYQVDKTTGVHDGVVLNITGSIVAMQGGRWCYTKDLIEGG